MPCPHARKRSRALRPIAVGMDRARDAPQSGAYALAWVAPCPYQRDAHAPSYLLLVISFHWLAICWPREAFKLLPWCRSKLSDKSNAPTSEANCLNATY